MRWLLAVVALAAVAFVSSALLSGSHSTTTPRFSVRASARPTSPRNALPEHLSKVFGSTTSAKRYGQLDALRENDGANAKGQLVSDLAPLSPTVFVRPIAEYRVYAERWSRSFAHAVSHLHATLVAGGRAAAERAWNSSFFDFMHLGADYNLLPTGLTAQIVTVPSQLGERRFPGLHRIELGLWTGQPLRSLLPAEAGVASAARRLESVVRTTPIDTLDYTLRIHEVLEDAARDLLTGADVPWSGSGVLGTEAGVIATRELLATVKPILEGRDNSYGESENWLDTLQGVLLSARRADHGWPTVHALTTMQRERIDGAMAGTLSALEQVPGALETREITGFPKEPEQRHAR